ncbi:hypothetical protein D3C80_1670540 [compost metagenome]
MAGIRARVGRLENASYSKLRRSVVVVMADGHPPKEIGAFLTDKGVHQDGRQPIIVFNAGHANNSGERKPLRMI